MKKIIIKLLISMLCVASATFVGTEVQAITIVLDPGHGGDSTGAVCKATGIAEKIYTMKIANYLKEYLDKYEVTVYLTHESVNDSMELIDRGLFVRSKKADMAISLHLNDVEGTLNGAEVWVTQNTSLPKYNANSTALANEILKNLGALGIANRGVKTKQSYGDSTDVYSDGTISDYYGIIRYSMRGCKIDFGKIKPEGAVPANIQNGEGVPAIIVEHCFINGSDYQFFNTEEKIKKLAEADGKAIVDYYKLQLKKPRVKIEPFNDVFEDDWYANCVKYVYNNGIIKGYNSNTFAPNDKLTRGMLVTVLYRMEGSPKNDGKSSFLDVDSNEWYSQAVKWAKTNGIVHGYGNTNNFGPNDNVKREDMVVILQNYAQYKKKNTQITSNLSKFKDYKNVDDYANSAIQWAVGKGVITGNDDGTLNPQETATRAEAAAVMQKYCNKVGK